VKSVGVWLIVASSAFWLSWLLMPGVGVTDTATIFRLVGEHRSSVYASVVLQLLSAAAYAPGIVGIAASAAPPRGARAGGTLVAIGAMGSAADAIFHLVAYEMTAPNLAPETVAPVMRRLQGPDLALLLPFVAAFFLGHVLLVRAFRGSGPLARLGNRILLAAPAIVVVGGFLVRLGLVPGRVVGLGLLAAISGSLAMVGLSFTGAR
jgi:hypothetical protein